MSVRGREEVRICCAVCIWENYPLILTDYHFRSTCIRLAATGVLIYVLTKIYKVSC